ncbi:glycosyltransferase [Parabacteroides bouchesdurhonensis]|uniref:glycosyltransferase n=1 Tax=Parabacteroides bouchesdurhonensis TaxID=1936995 RepID=UPI000E51A7C4|nr:glycosyltransferase [Parabacteroides bouchesdurhonensis]RHJ94915.1 glycosyltransferase [Bacteroides sp. AM07-16]
MKVQHVITSMGLNWGGPALTTLLVVRGLRDACIDAGILTYGVRGGDRPISDEGFIVNLPSLFVWQLASGWSSRMKEALRKTYPDIYHIQGLWQYPQYETARTAQRKNIPYVVTLHGQLYPQALALSGLKKKVALSLYQRRQLQQAACIHATCMDEYGYYRALGFTNPVAVVPNPIDCNAYPLYSRTDTVKRVGYLGRIHPRKNIHRLIDVWARLNEENGVLLIMGDGDKGYLQRLHEQVQTLKLRNVFFTGFVKGEKKQQLLASLSCLAVPSDFENFGMIIPEALLQHVPVIASTGTPWAELNRYKCGWWVDNDADTLVNTLREALSLNEEIRYEMGNRGRELMLRKYSVETVAVQMKQMYDWATGNGPKPGFVFTD